MDIMSIVVHVLCAKQDVQNVLILPLTVILVLMGIIKQVLEILAWNAPVYVKNVLAVLQIVQVVSMDIIMIVQHANNVQFHVINVKT